MERFLARIVGGGVALVAGLWLGWLFEAGTTPWLAGSALVAGGAVALAAGMWTEVELR